MSKGQRLKDYLGHILEAIQKFKEYTRGMSEEKFGSDEKTQDAVIRNFEIIGEACQNVKREYPSVVANYPGVLWEEAYEMRNILAHAYFKVDVRIVWETIQKDLVKLEQQIHQLNQSQG